MGLNAEERKQLEALNRKAKEPDAPAPNVNFNLDLGSDTAWERAKQLGIVPGGNSDNGDDDDDDSDDDQGGGDEIPRRRSSLQNRIMGVED